VGASVGVETGSRALGEARRLSACVAAGALAGGLVGGVGGRIAMLVLRLTSDTRLHGLTTDDGFTIGIVSSGTVFLIGITTILGAMLGAGYLLVRTWLPARLRPWVAGLLGAVVGGARIVRPDGIDFTLLDPLPLAVAMFVAIPAGVGIGTSLLAERFLRQGSVFMRSRAALVPLLLLLPVAPLPIGLGLRAPLALTAAGVVALLALFAYRRGVLGSVWSSAPVAWLGRAVLAAAAVLSAAELTRDITAIL